LRFSIDLLTKGEGEGQVVDEVEEEDVARADRPSKDGIDEILRPNISIDRASSGAPSDPFAPAPKSIDPLHPIPNSPPPMPFAPDSSTPRTTYKKYFQVTIDRSRTIHQDYIERQPYWRQFDPMKSMAQEDLAKKVPQIGLSDVSKRPPNGHRTPNRVLKQMSYHVEKTMPKLMDMWEDGGREKKESDRLP
jgi:hypothetical protein